ncbi:MAG: hypothetical protein BWY71_01122 [Planctomycetes bacterium ADurb.Bin412]|nr:MAG: hypothetical protein BWY71_01122 [Planctomycetes bacterium ADurb.Bin412]
MVNGFFGLGHHSIIGGHHQYRDIGHICPPCPHFGKGFVARGIQKGNPALAIIIQVRADVLGNTAGLSGYHAGTPNPVQQGGLAVIHMAQKGYHRRTGGQFLRRYFFFIFLLDGFQH